MCHGTNINNIESLIITNMTNNQDNKQELYLMTPPQNLGSLASNSPKTTSTVSNSKLFTPDESPGVQPLCLSGFEALQYTKLKPVKICWDAELTVSKLNSIYLHFSFHNFTGNEGLCVSMCRFFMVFSSEVL